MTNAQADAYLRQVGATFKQRRTEGGRTVDWYWSASQSAWFAKTYIGADNIQLHKKAAESCGC